MLPAEFPLDSGAPEFSYLPPVSFDSLPPMTVGCGGCTSTPAEYNNNTSVNLSEHVSGCDRGSNPLKRTRTDDVNVPNKNTELGIFQQLRYLKSL